MHASTDAALVAVVCLERVLPFDKPGKLQENERLRRELSNLQEQHQAVSQHSAEVQISLRQAQADVASSLQVLYSCPHGFALQRGLCRGTVG